MNKKRIISILLVAILLINSILPVVQVSAVSNNVFEFNQTLYKAIKRSLKNSEIFFKADDIAGTIEISDSELAKVTKLVLNESAIYDLTNIDSFKYLTYLDVSGNNLTEESNLGALNGLESLNYLDLSSNRLLDVSEIDELILKIQSENGTVLLSNQVATLAYDAVVDIDEGSNNEYTAKYELPKILEKAGIIKSVWRNAEYILEDGSKITGSGFIESMSNPVTENNNFIEVKIASEEGYVSGLAKLEIYIYDDPTEAASAANINPAANNILVGSRFTIYVSVHDSETEAVYFPDTNLYKSVKEQLSAGQEVNSNLPTYKYLTDENGEKYSGKFFYMADIKNRNILYLFNIETVKILLDTDSRMPEETSYDAETDITTMGREDIERILTFNMHMASYVLNKNTNEIYYMIQNSSPMGIDYNGYDEFEEYDGMKFWYHDGEMGYFEAIFITKDFEETTINLVDDISGYMDQYQGYKFTGINVKSFYDLYTAAYDEARILIISRNDLYSTIDSLVLDNREIRDLTGIEKFVALNSCLDVSHNYLTDITPIYELEANKSIYENDIRNRVSNWLQDRKYGNLKEAYELYVATNNEEYDLYKEKKDLWNQLIKKYEEAKEIKATTTITETITAEDGTQTTTTKETSNPNYDAEIAQKAKEIDEILKQMNGYDDENGNRVEGLYEKTLKLNDKYEEAFETFYESFDKMYETYNDIYKLSTILIPELNYSTYEEYKNYENLLNGTSEEVKELYMSQLAKLQEIAAAYNGFSIDEAYLVYTIVTEDANGLYYLQEDFDEYITDVSNSLWRYNLTELIEKYISDYIVKMEKTAGNRIFWVNKIKDIEKLNIALQMMDYCRIENLEDYDDYEACKCEEYLAKRINEFELEGIDHSFESSLLKKLEDIDENVSDDITGGMEFEDCIVAFLYYFDYLYVSDIYDEETIVESGDYPQHLYMPRVEGSYINLIYYDSIEDMLTDVDIEPNDSLTAVLDLVEGDVIYYLERFFTLDEYWDYIEIDSYAQVTTDTIGMMYRMIQNADQLDKYVKLPNLKSLDVSYNANLNDISKVDTLTHLRELNMAYDYIDELSNTNWEAFEYLRKLDVSYNFLKTIKPLEVLKDIEELNVSNNLLSGALEFNLTNSQKTLKEFDLSGNQLEDITDIMNFLDAWADGNDGNYIAREDTININLNNQTINIDVEEPIDLLVNSHTVDIELPKIFTQLKAIDVKRTTYGTESLSGRVESEGRYVTLLTDTIGDKEGIVKVQPTAGNDTCVGNGTKAIIKYKVVSNDPVVSNVEIKTDNELVNVKAGDSITFTAEVTGEYLKDTTVIWTIEGNESENTTISEDGVLTIGEDETAEKIIVIATSNFDSSVIDQFEVTLQATSPVDPTEPVDPADPADPKPGVDIELGYEQDDEYIIGVAAKTPVEEFKTILLNGNEYEVVIKKDGEEITSGIMKTGMDIQIQDKDGNAIKDKNGKLAIYKSIVIGDVNGDGYANSLDSLLIKAHRTEVEELKGEAFAAGDINHDGKVNITDSKLLLYHRAEVRGYDLNYSK